MKNLLVIVVDATLDLFDVDGHDPYVVTTWIEYAEDYGPLYVVSLPSGLCFKVWTSLLLGHLLVNTMSHISKMSFG